MAEIILDTIKQELGNEMENRMRSVLREFGLCAVIENNKKVEEGWVNILEAKKIVPIKSKKKWKELRDEAQVDFAKVGKGFIYEINSLHKYIVNHSTITKTKSKKK